MSERQTRDRWHDVSEQPLTAAEVTDTLSSGRRSDPSAWDVSSGEPPPEPVASDLAAS